MKKFFNTLALSAASALAFATAPAAAQTATPTTTSPNTTTCSAGCPSTLTVAGVGAFGGTIVGGFGALDVNGNLTGTNGVTGTVKGTKTGGADTNIQMVYNGPGCSISCGSARVNADISAYERGSMTVTVNGSAPGMFGAANSGTMAAGAALSIGYNPGPSTTTTTTGH